MHESPAREEHRDVRFVPDNDERMGKKACSHCPYCGAVLTRTYYTTSGLVFCSGKHRDNYYAGKKHRRRKRS